MVFPTRLETLPETDVKTKYLKAKQHTSPHHQTNINAKWQNQFRIPFLKNHDRKDDYITVPLKISQPRH